jgi:vacuolar-type H+-ATPase subunit E/Vma4
MSVKTYGIAELISQIHEEGISKIETEREKIISLARNDAKKIVTEAEKNIKNLYEKCNSECDQKRSDLDCELKMAARDFLLTFSKNIKSFIIRPIIKKQLNDVMNDTKFLKVCLKAIFQNILTKEYKNILVLLNTKTKNDMIEFFGNDIFKDTTNKNKVNFAFTNEFSGFQIIRKDDKLIWDFTIETLTQEIGKIVEPNLLKYFL